MKENAGKSKYVVLGMLARMPQTGYTIKKWIEQEYSHFWQESFGQIYPTLKKLVAEGFAVSSDNTETGNGRGQIVYSITDTGRKELSDWLREEPEIEKLRYEILLKVSFGENTESKVLLGHLDDFIRRNEKLVKDMNGYIERFEQLKEQGKDCTYSQLTALCGVYVYSAMNDWAVKAKDIISGKQADLRGEQL
jgi:DNA-binding PadR family transcriptional regulator